MQKPLIGFIGQGFIGGSYADDYENRGYEIVRYSHNRFKQNKEKIKDCDIVFIAVPTPTTPDGFDDSILQGVLPLVGDGKTAVIKSTMQVGTTEKFQKMFPDKFIFHSPEFLTEKTAAHDAAHPDRNIIGITDKEGANEKANQVIASLPFAPIQMICDSKEAELIKYGGNCWFVFKVLYINMLYDLCKANGCDYDIVSYGMSGDPRIGHTHLTAVHSGRVDENRVEGRGAGGHCFIKDFAAFREMYEKHLPVDDCPRDGLAMQLLDAAETYNKHLLTETGKDLDLLRDVYGE